VFIFEKISILPLLEPILSRQLRTSESRCNKSGRIRRPRVQTATATRSSNLG
jgi:hypothetical protein